MKKGVSTILKILITGLVLWWIFTQYGVANITATLQHARHAWWISAVFVFVISIVLGSFQWYLLLKNKNVEISYSASFRLYYSGIFLNNFMLGLVAGGAYRVASLHYGKSSGKSGFAATFLDQLAGLLALCVFALGGGIILFIINVQQGKEFFKVLALLSVFGSIFFGIFFLIISQRLQQKIRWLLSKVPKRPIKDKIEAIIEELFLNRRGKRDQRLIGRVFLLSIGIQLLRIIVPVFSAQALGIFQWSSLYYFFVIIPVIALLMMLPLPFGVREVTQGFLFGLAGFSVEKATIMSFLASIVGIIASCGGGILFICGKKNKHN